MKLHALADKDKIKEAYDTLAQRLTKGGEPCLTNVGYQGGSETVTVIWHASAGMWVLLEPQRIDNRYWCAYGLDEPHSKSIHSITCEINIPRAGLDRRIGGAFARDVQDSNRLYLVHSGKVGGGRTGIGREAFLDFYTGKFENVYWGSGPKVEYILLGALDDEELLSNVVSFVRRVAKFKEAATSATPG